MVSYSPPEGYVPNMSNPHGKHADLLQVRYYKCVFCKRGLEQLGRREPGDRTVPGVRRPQRVRFGQNIPTTGTCPTYP